MGRNAQFKWQEQEDLIPRFREVGDVTLDLFHRDGRVDDRWPMFIQELQGSYSGVMGLPLYETATLLNEFGIKLLR